MHVTLVTVKINAVFNVFTDYVLCFISDFNHIGMQASVTQTVDILSLKFSLMFIYN